MIVRTIGSVAHGRLQQEQDAVVLGTVQRGIFLNLACGWVVFLSKETRFGPLTLNVAGEHNRLDALRSASPAQIMRNGILFPQTGLLLQTNHAQVWRLPDRSQHIFSPAQRRARLATVIQTVASRKTTPSLSALQALLAGAPQETGQKTGQFLQYIQGLHQSLSEGQSAAIVEGIAPLLGYGPGLTPSGDDLVMGLLLALNRWGDVIAANLDILALNRAILPLAYHKTTTLAANLIECATQGQADEHLVAALDGLMSGVPDAQTCAVYLAGWGNSSGIDALAGMATLIAS